MITSEFAFSDDIINITELKKNWPQWGERARNQPVTILYKDEPLTLMSRKVVGELTKKIFYTNVLVGFCQGFLEGKSSSQALPWTAYLKSADRRIMLREMLRGYEESFAKDDWTIFQTVMDDWKATAEVESNPRLAKILTEEDNPSEYVEIKD